MKTAAGPTSSAEREAFRGVRRACYAGLDSVALRTELARRVAPAIPMEAFSFSTTDPDTGLLTHAVAEGVSGSLVQAYVERVYPLEDALRTVDMAREGSTVVRMTDHSTLLKEALREEGLVHEMNTLPSAGGELWGSWCMLREAGSSAFSEREAGFMRRVAPHIARGLKAAALLDTARGGEPDAEGGAGLGVLVLDARARVVLRNPAAAAYLRDLADVGIPDGEIPYAVASVLLRLSRQVALAGSAGGEDAPADAELRVRGRSGRWYTLRASRTEPDAGGGSSSVVAVEPLSARELAPFLTRLYGLSPREREVTALAARGESTKRIAARLGLSAYTVQDHLGRACEKVGVRGRRALVAKLFFDGYAPRLGR